MKLLLFLLILANASVASAQTISVKSGEHDGFSRLVFTFPSLKEWKLVRESDGYGLAVTGPAPDYDLSGVFRRLSAGRLTKIYRDDTIGRLHMELACDCHAVPFELRNGVLVVDIVDGVAPANSPFELADDGSRLPSLSVSIMQPQKSAKKTQVERKAVVNSVEPPKPIPPSVSSAIAQSARLPQKEEHPEMNVISPSLVDARDALLRQLSKGAAEGVVEVTEDLTQTPPYEYRPSKSGNMRIGQDLGLVPNTTKRPSDHMTGIGNACTPDSQLDIYNWTEDESVSGFAASTTGFVGEFDRPNPETIARAVRYYLSLGFGAEARLLLKAFGTSSPERPMWETMSYIIDLDIPPEDFFSGMEVCDTSASMWSVLATTNMPTANRSAIPAILRTFSALPIALRRQLGPGLANRFLARDDAESAQAVEAAILRAGGEANPGVQFMEAEIDLATGDTASAEDLLSSLSGISDPAGLQATMALIRTQVDLGQEAQADLTTTAEALLQEAMGGQDEQELRSTLALAYASQNRFGKAFGLVASLSPEAKPVWEVLAKKGNDEAILDWAIFKEGETLPELPSVVDQKLANRLLELGFPDQAILWIDRETTSEGPDSEQEVLLAAQAELSRNDFLSALDIIKDQKGEKSAILRARVLAAMKDSDAADQLFQAGQTDEAIRAAKQQHSWHKLIKMEQNGIWSDAVGLVTNSSIPIDSFDAPLQISNETPKDDGPLAQTRAALSESAAARNILDELLSEQRFPELTN
ncbi:MAG: hypothetical protein WBA92_18425 [Pseudorhodobacter sp.]